MARSELNKEDLTEDDIFNLLQKASEADVRKKLGFWAVPLPKSDQTDSTNKKYIGKNDRKEKFELQFLRQKSRIR